MMIRVMTRGAGNKKLRATKLSEAKLDALIEEATVDAYTESEQMMGFHTMLDEHLDMPFKDRGARRRGDDREGRFD